MSSNEEHIANYLLLLKFAEVDLSNLPKNPKEEIKKIRKLPKQDPEVLKRLLQKLGESPNGDCRESIKLWVNEVVDFCNDPQTLEQLRKFAVIADFSADSLTSEAEKQVTFTNRSKNATSFIWDFGDGETKKVQNPSDIKHKFKKSGEIIVTLTAENEYSQSSKSLTIFVHPPAKPKAEFSIPTKALYVRSEVLFDDQSRYAETTTWEYGDGTSGTESRHTYKKPGDYIVMLTVTNTAGTDSAEAPITILTPEKVPAAKIRCYTDEKRRVVGNKLTFNDASTYSPSAWEWDFGDGETASGPEVKHEYAKEGKYTVTLTVSNETGKCESPATEKITILPPPPKPTAKFEVKKILGKTVTFKNLSSKDPSIKYAWEFGDGSGSRDVEPTHEFGSAGTYIVTLTVKNEATEEVFSLPVDISPSPKPKAEFKVQNRRKDGNTYYVTFVSTAKHAVEWEWDFGDGYLDTDKNPPPHAYFQKGKVTVSLTVTNDEGYSDTSTQTIRVESQKGVICCGGGVLVIAIIVIAGIFMAGNFFDDILPNQVSSTPFPTQTALGAAQTQSSLGTSDGGISLPYSKTHSFPTDNTEEVSLDLVDIEPVVYISTSYTVKDISEVKGYTDSSGRWVEKKVTRPDPSASFELIVTDADGKVVAAEGYGGKYDSGSTDKIKLLSAGTYHVQLSGKSIEVKVDIR